MKDIGFTQTGARIVEMSEEEHSQLVGLNHVVEGKFGLPYMPSRDTGFTMDFDFSKTFEVIRAWYLARMNINHMRELLDIMQESMEKK